MKAILLPLVVATSFAVSALQDPPKPEPSSPPKETVVVKAASIKWADHPNVPGAKMAAQNGDPSKGPAVVMIKFPKGTTVPAHWHTSSETVTIISGSAVFGSGETVDAAKGTEVSSGSYVNIPSKNPHWVIVKEELLVTMTLDKAADFHLCDEKK